MVNPNDNLHKLYENGLKHFSLPDFDTFSKDMKDEEKRRRFYNNMQKAYSLPDFDTFSKDIGAVAAQAPAKSSTTKNQQAQTQASTPVKQVTSVVNPVVDRTATSAKVENHPTAPAVKQPEQTTQQTKEPTWQPTEMQRKAIDMQIGQANEQVRKTLEDNQQFMENIQKGNMLGASTGEQVFNPQTGKMEKVYYTQQGDRVSTPMEQSRKNTEYHTWWENNTEDGQRSKNKRLQREFEGRLSSLWSRHDPAEGENAAEQAWDAAEQRLNEQSEKIIKHESPELNGQENVLMKGLKSLALGGRENRAMATGLKYQMDVARLTNFDLDRLMEDSWNNLGEKGQQSLIDDCHQMLRYRYPGEDDLLLYTKAEEMARQQSDKRLYDLAVEKNRPKNELEYLARKISDGNMVNNITKGFEVLAASGKTGDMAAYEAANEEYRQDGHKVLGVVGTVGGFALDPTTWISGGIGSAAAKGAMWAGGRYLVGRGATAALTNAAARQFATTLTGRIVSGVVGGAANFGAMEGIKEAETQFAHGGHIVGQDQSGRYMNEGYSAGAVGKQLLHGSMMGAAIGWLSPVSGNVSDKLVRGTSSTVGKVATRASVFTGSTVLEGTIFSVPEWLNGDQDAMDVWTDNMAMMVGFKAKGMIKSAGSVLGDLKKSLESPTNGTKNRLDFESRLRMRMDAPSDGGMALTKDEKAELERNGYGDLRSLVESAERQGNPSDGSLITKDAPKIVSRLTDMLEDNRVSEAARAKMYYYATGKQLPPSTIMRGEMIEDGDGGFIVESQGANGVITSRSFKDRKAADLELERIKRQAEINQIEKGEQYQQNIVYFENRLQDACRKVAEENGWDMVQVYRTCEEARRNHLKGADKNDQLSEAQQNILRKVVEAIGDYDETTITDEMRGRINDKYGVDIDKAIRKDERRRTEAENSAIQEYINELIPNKAKERTVEDADATDVTDQKLLKDQKLLTDSGEPTEGPINGPDPQPEGDINGEPHEPNGEQKPIGRAVMQFQDRQVEVLSGNVVMTDDGKMVDHAKSDNTIVIRDINTGKVEMVAPKDILSYEPYKAEEATTEATPTPEAAADEQPEATEQPKYGAGRISIQNSDGSQSKGWLTGTTVTEDNYDELGLSPNEIGKYEYYVEGDLSHLHYASEQELDSMVTDFKPDTKQQEETPTQAPTTTEGADPNEYQKGYTAGMQSAEKMTDEELNAELESINNEAEQMTDAGSGYVAALQYEQQRRQQESGAEVANTETNENITENAPNITQNGEFGTENGPNITENGNLRTENAPSSSQSVENEQQPAVPAEEQTPLQSIPRDENGEPIFEQAETPEVAWDGLIEFSEGDKDTAKEIADTMVEEKRKVFEKAQKLKSKGKTPTEILQSKRQNAAELAKAQQELEQWQKIAGVEQARQDAIRREQDAIRSKQEAEEKRLAAERAEQEREAKAAQEEAERKEREALEGIPEWHRDTPENARARGARRFQGQLFVRQEPIADAALGKEVNVKFSQEDIPHGRVAVIEASQLQPSHIQGKRNPMYFIDEAQPKNRSEAVSTLAAQQIAENIRPEEITGSTTAYTGAPTVNTRGEVVQGNNRTDALRYLWENSLPEQQAAYKQYLLDNAEQLGIDAETVNSKQQPVLVNMLDVDDNEAIRLGQMTANDTESGGVERIKPKNVAQKLGDDMRKYANMLLRSADEDASFGQLVDSNGADVLKWMNQVGAISNTQYQSAFNSKGAITPEAKNDLQKVLYQAVFKGATPQLEELFDKLPAKAQRAILSTAFRDMDSPFAGKALPEIQASIVAYNELERDEAFKNAKNLEQASRAIEDYKRQLMFDDRSEQVRPSDNFSNFALHLAGLYKAGDMSQTTIASYFNRMFDYAQGKVAASLFSEADTTLYPLAEAIKKVFNFDYKPAKNGNNNDKNGGPDVALSNTGSTEGEPGSNEPYKGGEQAEGGTEPTERRGRTARDSATGGDESEHERVIPQEVSGEERTEMQSRIVEWLSDENLTKGIGKTRTEIFEEFGNEPEPIAYIPAQYLSYVDPNISDPRIYCGKGYFIDHALRNHAQEGMQIDVEDVDVSKYLNIQTVLDSPDAIKETFVDGKRTVVFIKKIGRYFAELTQVEENGKIILHKSTFNQKKEPYAKIDDIRHKSSSSEGGTSSISHADESASAISLESRGDDVSSEGKVNTLSTEKQAENEKSSTHADNIKQLTEDVDQTPTNVDKDGNIVDANGTTLTLYHGTPNDDVNSLSDLEPGHHRDGEEAPARFNGDGISFTPNRSVAEDYASDGHTEGKVFEANITLKKPYYTVGVANMTPEEAAAFTEKLKEQGYDGIINYASKDMREAVALPNEVIVFDKSSAREVKSPLEETADKIAEAEQQVNNNPTEAQKEAGNYKKGHVKVGPFDVTIENTQGSVRRGTDSNGKQWETPMKNSYGYFRGTEGVDGDHIDVFLANDIKSWDGKKAFVVDQTNSDGTFDEHKVMLGFNDKDAAMEAYLANYDANWADTHPGLRISEVNMDEFKKWVDSSHRKTKPFADYAKVDKITDEHPTGKEPEGYTIEPRKDTRDNSDIFAVKFEDRVSREEFKGQKAIAKEHGGYWSNFGKKGFLFKTREDAQAFADAIMGKSEDEVADQAPLSMADMSEKQQEEEPTVKKVDVEGLFNALYTKGSTKLSDHATPVEEKPQAPKPQPQAEETKPKRRKWISDKDAEEFDTLRNSLRSHLGGIPNIAKEDEVSYGKQQPKEMDAEVLRMGTRMTYLMMKGGLRSFSDYAEAMVDELGEAIRPHLKPLYAATQNMEEVMDLGWDEEMDDRKTVKAFDVYNFDKQGAKDIIGTAQQIVDENASQQQTDKLIETIKEERNEQRRKEADKTSADTEAVVNQAETTASQVESKLENATTEEDAERLDQSINKEIEEVNKQLALLGYYEADEVDKDYNEMFGYMRNAERKATQDAHQLATQLAKDLGLAIDAKDKVKADRRYGFGSKIAHSNIAPAGGEVTITLPLGNGKELSMVLFMEPNSKWITNGRADRPSDDLVFKGGYFRAEDPEGRGENRYLTGNHDITSDVTYDALIADVRRAIRHLLPEEKVKPATPLKPNPGEDLVKMAARVSKENETHNGFKRGDYVMWDRVGNGKWEKQQIVDFDEDGSPILNSFGTNWIKEKADWSRIKKIETQNQTIGDLFGPLFAETKEEEPSKVEPKNKVNNTQKDNDNEKTDVRPSTETTGRGRQQPRSDESLGESAAHENERTDRGGVAERSGEHPVSDTKRSTGVSGLHQSERGVTEPKNTHNNHAERGVDYAPKGEKARIDANIAAIELAKKLLESGATATPQEMTILRKYSGWGGLGAAFNEGNAWSRNPVNQQLRKALTQEEYDAAVMSRNSAYYTPAPVIDAMWDIAKALGFKGGNIVEGSAGIGNILGLMPTDISERSNIHAVEIDKMTGGILSLLYPDAKVDVQGFEKTHIGNGTVDLAITNVPFVTGLHVMDESGDSDLSKKFRDIHDFCIAKNVRKLREGGIGIFITSSGTLDKSQKLRNWIVGEHEGNADVVGAFRMNNQTFGGTAATSDIIVIRKRVNGQRSANAIDVSTVSPARTAAFTDGRKTRDLPLLINRYFIEHPENMGGEMFFGFEQGDNYRPTSMGLFPTRSADQTERIAAWVKSLADKDWKSEQGSRAEIDKTSHINEALGEGVKEGSMVLDSDGNICIARSGRAVPVDVNNNKIKGHTKQECFKDYTAIKDALAEVLKYQTEHDDDKGLQPLLNKLNNAYDSFVKKYGNLNKNNNLAWMRNDVDFSSIVALETYSERGDKNGSKIKEYGKTDIFSRRVVDKETEPAPTNVKDGIIASLYKFGRIDSDYLAEHLGKSKEEIKNEMVERGLGFENPTTGQMEVSYEYLSGNVREKLRQAKEAEKDNPGAYTANIKALEAVVPMNIPAHLIEFTLGSSWIDPKLYERFVKERTDLDVTLTSVGGTWHMGEPFYTNTSKNTEMGVRSEAFGTLIPGHKLIEAAITNKSIVVSKTYKMPDGSTETERDPSATAACMAKIDEIRQDFKDWAREQMQADPDMSMRMEEEYNEQFNNSVPKQIPDDFVPEHFGGAATVVGGKPFKLRPHQAKAVIRATTQPVLLAHEVGTGKTYTLITTAMEMRRLGTARKPMIVVQNATVGQFVASAKALYPNAKVLTLEDADRNAEGRKAFYAKIKFNDWDMIVVPQSVFERIPDSIERQTRFIQDKIEEKMLVLEQMKNADPHGNSIIVKQAEREISRLEDEIAQLASGGVPDKKKEKDAKKAAVTRQNAEVKAREMLDRETDDVEDFDSMGIDAILVDEAHEYKHLGFATAMQRGVKGVDPSYSKKSQGVFLKAQSVLEKTGGKNVVFATGTPISNTAAEIWTFMRYLMPADQMKEYGIYYFDDFVRNFGNIQQMLEFGTNGKPKENNRFAGYVNLPELVRIWSTVADTVLTREAGGVSDKIPSMEGGKAQDIFLPQTRALRSILKYVNAKLDEYDKMSGKEKKANSHIPLVMYGIAKAAAVDARLVQADAEDDPNSKTNEAVRQTLQSLEETKDYKGTVAIFADNYQNKATGFNLYEDIRSKLIAQGVPAEQIVVMKSGMSVKKKLEIFDKVNAGDVRVILGSTFTLGTGVNIQDRLNTLIHVDAPNRPMDYTQRNGRILRQGNLHKDWNKPVKVLRFGVEDSLDVTAYQRLKTKGAIADSIMNGKQLMSNSMDNRSMEEDQDLFGDMTAQLSGSEYAMMKNQIEKEVRKLRAKQKAWEADQTYIHNRKRQIAGQNKEAEQRAAENKVYLEKVEKAEISNITVGKQSFANIDAMEDFFSEQNKKKRELQEQVRTGYNSRSANMDITVSVGGFDFKIHTEITQEMKQGQGALFASAPAKMTYSCEELGIEKMPVKENLIKNAISDIVENVVTGNDFRERIESAERSIERNNEELHSMELREGKPFQFTEELAQAESKLDEYDELMKKEMAEKEAKYADMDKDVQAATGVEYTEEDDGEEETANESEIDYSSRKNANFASKYETQEGHSINYSSEHPEGYDSLSGTDFEGENKEGRGDVVRTGANGVQREENPLQDRRNNRLNPKTNPSNESGEFCKIERVFIENGNFNFTSGEKIESADDVAYIFSALEEAGKEHSFVVLVKDGKPTVVELGMGTFNATMADTPTASLAYSRINPDEVYFVHNHPSGNLKCSSQDVAVLNTIKGMSKVPVHGVIINLKSGKYGTFGTDGERGEGRKRIPEKENALTVHTLDKQIFADDYDPMSQPLVTSPEDVASFLNSHRMGDRAKVSFLIITQAGRIVGNIHTPFSDIKGDVDAKARYITDNVIQFGGQRAILYGDFDMSKEQGVDYQNMKSAMERNGGINLLDVVRVKGNFTRSANDEGILHEPGSNYGGADVPDIRFRSVEDENVLSEFAEGKTVKAYRTMQVIDGKLYSPMATKVGGKNTPEIRLGVPEQAEEHPEIIKSTKMGEDGLEQGIVTIDKGLSKGTVTVAYNPYIHASRTALNDQFTSAHIRPNLVTVEVEIPESELTSGYRALMAKNPVGEIAWHSGSVSGKLADLGNPRRVILSRYDKPVRIVPYREVAQMIAKQLEGTDIEIPYNTVQPQVRQELERLGVKVSEKASGSVPGNPDFGKAEYVKDQEIERINAKQAEMAQTSDEAKKSYAESLAKKLNTPIRIVTDTNELTHSDAKTQEAMRRNKGFYNVKTGEVVVVIPNHQDVEDVAATVFHEVVGHKGLRELVGDENYDAFCDEIYDHLNDELKQEVDKDATRRFMKDPGRGLKSAIREAVDELIARLSQKGFEDFTRAERSIWAKLKTKVLEAINKFLGTMKLPKWVKLGDNELRYMAWRSHERLTGKDSFVDMARDAAKRQELGIDKESIVFNKAQSEHEELQHVNEKFNNELEQQIAGTLPKEHIYQLGKPGAVLKSAGFPDQPIELTAKRLAEKSEQRNHLFNIADIKGLPEALQNPIAVFEYGDKTKSENVIVELERDGKKFVVGVHFKQQHNGIEVASIRGLFNKDTAEWLNWVNQGKAQYLNKEKIQALIDKQRTNLADVEYLDLDNTAKIIESFENPKISGEKLLFRESETGDIWNDRSIGLEERITNAALRLSNNQSDDLTLRNDAMHAIGGNLSNLLKAMALQKRFDQSTVKRVADLARILMQNGYLSGVTSGEMQRLLSAVKNSVGHKDVKDSTQKVMDIMVNNQLRNGEATLKKLLTIKGSKVDASGVEVQGVLDVDGQRTMEVAKRAMSLNEDDINDRIDEAMNRMSDPDQTIADQATLEYSGLNMALDYVQNIKQSRDEELALREQLKTAKEDKEAGRMSKDAYNQFVESTEDAIRKNKIERAEAYFNLVSKFSESLRNSVENAKAFREAEKTRVQNIHHNANSDMEGRPTNEHHKDDWKDKWMNNGFMQFLFAPLSTFDQVLRVFGNKSANGEGYLWNRFMRGWVDSRNKELVGVKDKFAQLDAKAEELFGKGTTWGKIIRMERNMPKAYVSFWDGGEMRDHELTQGNLLYIYMVDKMSDGRMKLRRMGITEDNIQQIENFLDPRMKELGDWLQDEFLINTRNEYNETHKRMFGASMAAIENYFPLKILANARIDKEEDVNQPNRPDGITTKTGSIIKRRVNNLALDITGADALSVILDHITQMEHWNAYAEWNRDLNTLRTYKHFRNQVINMTTAYGGGRTLWKNFNDLCLMAAGEYRPPVAKLDKSMVNIAKGVTAAKVSLRLYTALKQLLSAPAYGPEVSIRSIAKSIANPYGDFKWCLNNLPIFRERWHSRISGDPRLLKSNMDWKMWRSRLMELSARVGMTPNAFVDAVTVSIGAKAMYETRLKQYIREGYPDEIAEERAKQDATILFNQTQQSSEAPFLSTMQVDGSWPSVLFTVFRNSSMSYTRQEFDAIRNLKRNLTSGQRKESVEFMTKQILRDWGTNPDDATDEQKGRAQEAANKRFNKQMKKDVMRVATFGAILQLAWNLGPYLPYLIFGNNDDEKNKMWDDAMTHSLFGSVEGLTGGDVMSSFGNMAVSGEWNTNQLTKDMPLASDINAIINKFVGGKNAEAFNDMFNLLVQSGIGVNPQSITDTAVAIMDACGDDPALANEAAMFVMRIMQVPQSQLDKLYFDEIDLSGEEASKLTPKQLAQRYATYKVKRGTPFAPWSWSDEDRLDKYEQSADKKMKERLDAQGDESVRKAYADFEERHDAISKEVTKARKPMKSDYLSGAQKFAELQQLPDYDLYQRFDALDKNLTRVSEMLFEAQTPGEVSLIAETLKSYRASMVKALSAETAEEQQSSILEISSLMQDFSSKYQQFHQPVSK